MGHPGSPGTGGSQGKTLTPPDHSNTSPPRGCSPQLSPAAGKNSPESVQIHLSWVGAPHLDTTQRKHTVSTLSWDCCLRSQESIPQHHHLPSHTFLLPCPPHQLIPSLGFVLCCFPAHTKAFPLSLCPPGITSLPNALNSLHFTPVIRGKPLPGRAPSNPLLQASTAARSHFF